MTDITVIILTYNEEIHIERCIRSLQPIVSKIFIVDSFSTDNTVEIARSLGADVKQHTWLNYADQFRWGIDHCGAKTNWIMRMDSDEYLDSDSQNELMKILPSLHRNIDGVYLKRKVYFSGKWIRYGGFYPQILLRIWRTGRGHIEQRWMDEHIVLDRGAKMIVANAHIIDDNRKGFTFWIDKHNKYASREAADMLNSKYHLSEPDNSLMIFDDLQAKRTRMIKDKIYSRMPVGFRAFVYFFYRYVVRFGFLDGSKGFIWHFMQGFWYRLLVDVKIIELEERSGRNAEKIKELLRDEHGIVI